MQRITALHKKISQLEDGLLVLTFVLLTGFSLFQIIARNLFDSGVFWIEGASRVLVLWLALLGASAAGREGRHIRIELLEKYFANHFIPYLMGLTNFACAMISAWVGWYSAVFVWQEQSYGDIAFATVPLWLCEVIIPLVFVVLALRFFLQAIKVVSTSAAELPQ